MSARRAAKFRATVPLCAVSLLFAPAPVSGQTSDGFEEAWADLASYFRERLAEEGVVGASLAFVQDGAVLGHETYGLADRSTGRAVDERTIYHWASITKTLTGIAILQLRDRGLVRLDDPIVHYVPELRDVHDPFGDGTEITLRHLLSHSAGFRGSTWPWGGDQPWHPHEPTDWEQLAAMIPYTEVEFEPGTQYGYSNPGIVFLGQVIERVTGEDWEVYVDKNIFSPLGMHESYFDRTPYHLLPYRSNNYYARAGEVEENGLDFDTGITVSNGGWNAPVGDLVRYVSFLTGTPTEESGAIVLDRSSLEEMWQEHVPAEDDGVLRQAMGLTFFILEQGGLRFVGHTGGQKGFVSFFYVHPESGTAAIAAFNTLGLADDGPPKPDTRRLLAEIRSRLFTEVFPLFVQRTQDDGGS